MVLGLGCGEKPLAVAALDEQANVREGRRREGSPVPRWKIEEGWNQLGQERCECGRSGAGPQTAIDPGEISEQAGTQGPAWLADKAPPLASALRRAR
jgi:hypothetical protein